MGDPHASSAAATARKFLPDEHGQSYNQGLHQRQTQSLVLAPQLRQSLKILQVAALDLRSVIQEELQSNPTLEELPMEGVSLETVHADGEGQGPAADEGPETAPHRRGQPDAASKREEMDFSKEFEILGKFDDDWRDGHGAGSRTYTAEDAERRQHFFDSLVSEPSLQEHLMRQAELAEISPPGARGDAPPGQQPGRPGIPDPDAGRRRRCRRDCPLDAVQEARRRPEDLRPAGHRRPDRCRNACWPSWPPRAAGESLPARIVRDHFDLLTRRRIPEIARKLGAPADDVQAAIEEIGRLDPAPGRRFADDNNRVVVPDVTVEKDGGEWKIHPQQRLHSAPADLEHLPGADRQGHAVQDRSATTCASASARESS